MNILRLELNLRAFTGERRGSVNHHYLTGHVGVEHFAFDDKPELLPVPLAFLTPAEIATDGGALSGGSHLAERKHSGRHQVVEGTVQTEPKWHAQQWAHGLYSFEVWDMDEASGSIQHLKGSKTVHWFETQALLSRPKSQKLPSGVLPSSGVLDSWSSPSPKSPHYKTYLVERFSSF